MTTEVKYRNTGLPWCPNLPGHWNVKKLKYVALVQPSNVDKKSSVDEIEVLLCNYVDVYKNEFIHERIEFMKATATQDEIDKFKLELGDVLITKDSETPQDIAVPALVRTEKDNLICGYHLAQIRTNKDEIIGDYLLRLFQSKEFNSYFEIGANGITRFGISIDTIKSVSIPILPINEQKIIAEYLDEKTSQIETIITKKQKLIEHLKEERIAIINQAVTKGLNPKAEMKPSGIEWLGDIPKHWNVKKIKHLLKEKKGAIKTGPFGTQLKTSDYVISNNDNLKKVYTQRNVLDNNFKTGEDFINNDKFIELSAFEIFPLDLLITTRGSIGRAAIFPTNKPPGILHPCLLRIQINEEKVLNKWILNYFNETSYFIENVKMESNSTIIDVIYGNTIAEIILPIPPTIKEQTDIIEYLEEELIRIDHIIFKIIKEIELIKEYKTALINEVVTGKLLLN